MNPERLAELQRQRALVRDQLAWLDREIAAASADPAPAALPAAPESPAAIVGATPALDEIYQPDPVSTAARTRRGCLLLAFAVFLLGALSLTGIYFLRYRDRPLLGASAENSSTTAKHSLPANSPAPPRK